MDIPALSARAPISLSNIVWAEKTVSGTYYGSIRPDIDFPIRADLEMDKRLNLDDLISSPTIDEINEGFRLLVKMGEVLSGDGELCSQAARRKHDLRFYSDRTCSLVSGAVARSVIVFY